jgi:apolipoprotein N-acyltransferase
VQSGGVLLGLAFTLPWGGPLAWPALWLILRGLVGRSAWERAGDGSLAGVWWGMIAVGSWLDEAIRLQLGVSAPVSLVITFATIFAYGGAYLAVFTTVYGWLPGPRWLAGPALWVLLEQVRTQALGGAPWALLGHSQHAWLRLAQLAELGGVAALSFLIVLVAAAFAGDPAERRVGGAVAIGVVLVALGFGTLRLSTWSSVPADGATVQLVSGGHESGDRLTTYVTASRGRPEADLTVWPENALGEYLQDDAAAHEALIATSRRLGPLLVGGPRHEARGAGRRYYNSAFLIAPPHGLRGIYDKRLLVPFAERAVMALEVVPRPFTPGDPDQGPLEIGALRAGVLICWEGVFAAPARDYARAGAHVLVDLTSDEGLGRGATQQRWFSAFRAIETRRWLLRASGTGESTAVDPAGRVHRVDRVRLPATPPPATAYVRHGEVLPWLCGVLLVGLVGLNVVRTFRARGS